MIQNIAKIFSEMILLIKLPTGNLYPLHQMSLKMDKNGWIKCAEKLPEESETVLCYWQSGTYGLMLGKDRKWDKEFSHWQPLPKEPEDG